MDLVDVFSIWSRVKTRFPRPSHSILNFGFTPLDFNILNKFLFFFFFLSPRRIKYVQIYGTSPPPTFLIRSLFIMEC